MNQATTVLRALERGGPHLLTHLKRYPWLVQDGLRVPLHRAERSEDVQQSFARIALLITQQSAERRGDGDHRRHEGQSDIGSDSDSDSDKTATDRSDSFLSGDDVPRGPVLSSDDVPDNDVPETGQSDPQSRSHDSLLSGPLAASTQHRHDPIAAFLAVDFDTLMRALRLTRHRCMIRIAARELLHIADLPETAAEISALASTLVDIACRWTWAALGQHKLPWSSTEDTPIAYTVLGMGKLGGGELNIGSDIDLCFFYESDDGYLRATTKASTADAEPKFRLPNRPLGHADSVHDWYASFVRQVTKQLSEITDDGFCFRVDLRLRPEGTRGALSNSLAAAERYYEAYGRPWERCALLRARPIAGDRALGEQLLSILQPFIFPRRVDPSITRDMQSMLLRARSESSAQESPNAPKESPARGSTETPSQDPQRAGSLQGTDKVSDQRAHETMHGPGWNLKLGEGGIREVEFFVQTLQLIWGGSDASLRAAGTLDALGRLHAAGHISAAEQESLTQAWLFLRRLEHALHLLAGYATHVLPLASDKLQRLAEALREPSVSSLLQRLAAVRSDVRDATATLSHEAPDPSESEHELLALWDALSTEEACELIENLATQALGVRDGCEAAVHLRRLSDWPDAPLGPLARQRTPTLGLRLLLEVRDCLDPDMALRDLPDFFLRLRRPSAYARHFVDYPERLRQLVTLFGTSRHLSAALTGHPGTLDALLQQGAAIAPLGDELPPIRLYEDTPPPSDRDGFVEVLRRERRETQLRVGLEYLGNPSIETIASEDLACSPLMHCTKQLSLLASKQLRAAFVFAARRNHRVASNIAVLGLGKFGSGEMGFISDLDLCFVFDDNKIEDPDDIETATRIARDTVALLTELHPEGPGYSADLRLRPDGAKGLMVVGLSSFIDYYRTRAAPWEKLALTRARRMAGGHHISACLRARFDELIHLNGDPVTARSIAAIRGRAEQELGQEQRDTRHPKFGYGGIFDIELITQWLLVTGGACNGMRPENTLGALAQLRTKSLITSTDADMLAHALVFLRSVEQGLSLMHPNDCERMILRGPLAGKLARFLGIHTRDKGPPHQALEALWSQIARDVRGCFERRIAPIPGPAA